MSARKTLGTMIACLGVVVAGCTAARDDKAWKTYSSEKFGVSFQYPADWGIDPNEQGSPFLDIHLTNDAMLSDPHPDDNMCPPGSQAMELQIGHRKDPGETVSEVLQREELVGPVNPLLPFPLDDIRAWTIPISGWESCVTGPGYVLEQDSAHYTYILTGSNAKGDDTIEQIVRSVRFWAPVK